MQAEYDRGQGEDRRTCWNADGQTVSKERKHPGGPHNSFWGTQTGRSYKEVKEAAPNQKGVGL